MSQVVYAIRTFHGVSQIKGRRMIEP